MKIHTVVMTKESFSNPPVMEVLGSYRVGWRAKKSLIDKIIEMVQDDSDFASTMWTDENHPDIIDAVGRQNDGFFQREEKRQKLPQEVLASLSNYLTQEIGDDEGSYYVYSVVAFDRDATYRFDVATNDLELDPEE